jgi:hypothetical protein
VNTSNKNCQGKLVKEKTPYAHEKVNLLKELSRFLYKAAMKTELACHLADKTTTGQTIVQQTFQVFPK